MRREAKAKIIADALNRLAGELHVSAANVSGEATAIGIIQAAEATVQFNRRLNVDQLARLYDIINEL